MLTTSARKNSAGAAIDRAVRDALVTVSGRHLPTRAAFDRLLRHVRRRSDFLRPARVRGRVEVRDYDEVVSGLLSLATWYEGWIRPVETWEPAGDNPRPRFSSLARHLLAIYPVPVFNDGAWFKGRTAEARRQQGWFLHVGSGRNIRTADLPLPYTKMMAHHFLQAPDHFTVEAALRWGQVRGLGGSKELAQAVAATRLGASFEAEDFWLMVIHFLVNHPGLDLDQVGPVVDYLHQQKFVPQEGRWEDGELMDLGPPQPHLSMKGRTLRSLLRQVSKWHEQLKQPRDLALLRWRPCGIGGVRYIERPAAEGLRCWTIRELTSAEALRREGEAMRHCAGSYAGACARRETSVWSLCFENDECRFRVMTIEVDPTSRTICQARRRGNTPPNEKALGVLRLWAAQEGLKLNFWGDGELVVG